MADAQLDLTSWRALPAKQQEYVFQQLVRYFLSPLLSIDGMRPVSVSYYGQVFTTYEALIGGEWMRFVPGMPRTTLGLAPSLAPLIGSYLEASGYTFTQLQHQLSSPRLADIPPMLVAVTPTRADEQLVGRINLTSQRFFGDQLGFEPIKNRVIDLLNQRPAQSIWPPVLQDARITLRLAGPHDYQVLKRFDGTVHAITQALNYFGFQLPDEDQYEYLVGGPKNQLFAFGNQVPHTWPRYLPNAFGLTVPLERFGPELIVGGTKSGPVSSVPTAQEALALSPMFTSMTPNSLTTATYRRIAVVSL